MTIYLYVKTHRVTKLKYFGKTVRDPYKYRGSGKYWKAHLKVHGYDIDTVVIAEYQNTEEAKDFALTFSKNNDIVNSSEWANLIEENAVNGGDASKNIDYSYLIGNSHMIGNRGNTFAKGTIGNKASSGRIWITDGVITKSIRSTDPIPENFRKGRSKS